MKNRSSFPELRLFISSKRLMDRIIFRDAPRKTVGDEDRLNPVFSIGNLATFFQIKKHSQTLVETTFVNVLSSLLSFIDSSYG